MATTLKKRKSLPVVTLRLWGLQCFVYSLNLGLRSRFDGSEVVSDTDAYMES